MAQLVRLVAVKLKAGPGEFALRLVNDAVRESSWWGTYEDGETIISYEEKQEICGWKLKLLYW